MTHAPAPSTGSRKPVLAACFCLLLPGCVGFSSDRVSRETRFREIVTPADLAAVYTNKGESPRGGLRQLSYALCEGTSPSDTTEKVRFRSVPPSVLVCEALSRGRIVASRELVQDRDFRLEGGAMHFISTKAAAFLGEGVAGIERLSTTLRLTESGDIVLTQRSREAGMALLVVPVARVDTLDAVFRRVRE